jgi:hypothetical protein
MEYADMTLAGLGEVVSSADFNLGQAVGFENAATLILEMSKTAFAEEKDQRAVELRDLARLLREKGTQKRQENGGHLDHRRKAFDELSRRDELSTQPL